MRCYVEKDKENFVEKYGIVGKYIYILKGNKNVEIKEYSPLLEKEILNKMKSQVIEAQKEAHINANIKYNLGYMLTLLLCEWSLTRRIIANDPNTLNYVGAGFVSVFFGVNVTNLVSSLLNKKDLNKNSYYLNHEEKFNRFNKENLEHLCSVSGKAKKKINVSNVSNPLNINFISNISSHDLEKINENLKKCYDRSNKFSHTYRI